jgi:hypothetical protein
MPVNDALGVIAKKMRAGKVIQFTRAFLLQLREGRAQRVVFLIFQFQGEGLDTGVWAVVAFE